MMAFSACAFIQIDRLKGSSKTQVLHICTFARDSEHLLPGFELRNVGIIYICMRIAVL